MEREGQNNLLPVESAIEGLNLGKPPATDEQRKEWREQKADYRERSKANWNSTDPAKKDIALQIIADEWGITRSYFIDIIYEEGKRAAERNKLTDNIFYWKNGPVQTLASANANKAIPLARLEGDNLVVGEVTYRREIFGLWQFIDAWREDGCETFEEFLAERRSVKVGGTVNRGNKYFGKDFHEAPEGPHGRWDDMFVQWNPDLLKPEYTQEEMKAWLNAQSENKKRLLIACRNSYKSNFTLVYLVGGVLCCPDIRLLLISETQPLSLSFIGGFRSFWEIRDPFNPTSFQRLFREYCIKPDAGSSLEFQSPMSHLSLFQPTANSISMESKGAAGNRADIIVFDDPISNSTVGTEDQRAKSVIKYDALQELLEVGGYVHINATPWHEEDLSATILSRNEKSEDKSLLYIIDPAWTVKEHARAKDIWSLQEEDVVLLFPLRLTWKVLQKKLREGDSAARMFRMQSLCQFLPEEEEQFKLHFDKDGMLHHCIPAAPEEGVIYASMDLGFAKNKYADPTCVTILKIVEKKVFVLLQVTDYLRTSEKAQLIVKLYRQYPGLNAWLIEKYHSWEDLDQAVQREAAMYGTRVPLYWKPSTDTDGKFHRLKSIEVYISQGRVKFVGSDSTPWINDLVNELTKLDGTGMKRRSSTRRDDRGDSLALGIKAFMPSENEEDAETQRKIIEQQQEREKREATYAMIFGSDNRSGIGYVSSAKDWIGAQQQSELAPPPDPAWRPAWPVRKNTNPQIGFATATKKD